MATYGNFPGVQVTTVGGGVTAVDVGAGENLIIFGNGDASTGSASVNEPTQITSNRDADQQFGTDTELANAMVSARENGADIDFLYGVMYEEISAPTETFSGTASGTLSNAPIVEDLSTISVQDTVDATSVTVEFRYANSLSTPSSTDTMFINPLTGDFQADSSSDYDIDYDYPDWQSALDAADGVVKEDETGVYLTLSEAESVASTLATKVNNLRSQYQLITGLAGAQPNTNSSDNDAIFDTANYTDSLDDDALFLAAPVRLKNSKETVLPGAGGVFAGNDVDNPVFYDEIVGYGDMEQQITKTEEDELAAEQVIPVRQAASIKLKRSHSTSTATDWERDFWRRRIVDRVILIAKEIGDQTVGVINNEDNREAAEDLIRAELRDLADDGLIRGSGQFSVEVAPDPNNKDKITIDVGVTPFGIVKQIDASVTIDA